MDGKTRVDSSTAEAEATDPHAPWTGERLRRACFGAMLLMREIRHARAVESWLHDPEVLARAEEDAASARRLAECREWLVRALEHERLHRAGSLIDRTHPFWVDGLAPAMRRTGRLPPEQNGS